MGACWKFAQLIPPIISSTFFIIITCVGPANLRPSNLLLLRQGITSADPPSGRQAGRQAGPHYWQPLVGYLGVWGAYHEIAIQLAFSQHRSCPLLAARCLCFGGWRLLLLLGLLLRCLVVFLVDFCRCNGGFLVIVIVVFFCWRCCSERGSW